MRTQVASPSQRVGASLASRHVRRIYAALEITAQDYVESTERKRRVDSGGPGTQCRAPCQMLRSTSASTSAGLWSVLMVIAFPTLCASTWKRRMANQTLWSWASVAGQTTTSMSKYPWNARVTSSSFRVNWKSHASRSLGCRRWPTLNSAWIASGKILEEVNKRLCTFSWLMKMMKIEHPLPSYNRTGAMMLKKTGTRDLLQAFWSGPWHRGFFRFFGRLHLWPLPWRWRDASRTCSRASGHDQSQLEKFFCDV